MASEFIGFTILVTLQNPPNAQIQGVVADVVNQKLYLQNGNLGSSLSHAVVLIAHSTSCRNWSATCLLRSRRLSHRRCRSRAVSTTTSASVRLRSTHCYCSLTSRKCTTHENTNTIHGPGDPELFQASEKILTIATTIDSSACLTNYDRGRDCHAQPDISITSRNRKWKTSSSETE